MIVNQWLCAAHAGDGIGDHARRIQMLLRSMGHESEIYSLTVDEELRALIRRFDQPGWNGGDVTIFHYALPSPMTCGR